MVLRSWSPTMELKVDIGPCRQIAEFLQWSQIDEFSAIGAYRIEFSTVAAAVKFFASRPAKMNWDLKHQEMCRMLGVFLA